MELSRKGTETGLSGGSLDQLCYLFLKRSQSRPNLVQFRHDRHIFQILLERLRRAPCVHARLLDAVIQAAAMQKNGIVGDGDMIQGSGLSGSNDALAKLG